MPNTPLGVLIDARINELGLTNAAAARRVGIPLSTLHSYRKGQTAGVRVNVEQLRKIAKGLGLNVDDVLEAAGALRAETDELVLVSLFRRLHHDADKAMAVEQLRVLVRVSERRDQGRI